MNKLQTLEDFERKAMPDRYFDQAKSRFKEFYRLRYSDLQAAEKAYRNLVTLLLKNGDFPEPKVVSRIKDSDECIKKFDRKYRRKMELDTGEYEIAPSISDLIGIRIICIYESDIDKVVSRLESHFSISEKTDKTAEIERSISKFGYKGVHLDMKLNDQRKNLPEYRLFSEWEFEAQVRTIVQDAWSEIDHKLKYKKETPPQLSRRIARLSALFELADQEFEAIINETTRLEEAAKSPEFDEHSTLLDAFGFIRVSNDFFPEYNFQGDALDGLLTQIMEARPMLRVNEFRDILQRNISRVNEYREYMISIGNNMSPYTVIRHCFVLDNKIAFGELIFSGHRTNFDRWLKHGTVFLKEIEQAT